MLTTDAVLDALRTVEEPDLKRDLVTLGMIRDLEVDGRQVSFTVVLTTPACPLKDLIRSRCLQAIAAVVLGGTSLFGGIASIGGSILGSLVPVMLQNGLVILQVEPFYQFAIVGVILILAVFFDQRRRERAI